MTIGKILNLTTIRDSRGSLISLESTKNIPFTIKRVYYLYDLTSSKPRGFHAHRQLEQVIVCMSGSCNLFLESNDL